MKELSIEQKARAYDEALEKSKRLYEQGTITECLGYIFPELKKSEDERIRKWLICGMNALKEQKNETFATIPIDDAIAWLEKQGEQRPTQETEPFEAEHGKYYYCIKDYFCGGRKQASKGDVIEALRGLPIMGLKDASEYFLPVNSIKCYSAWKPSDEQIEILDMVLTNESLDDNIARILRELREQLKKLRENKVMEQYISKSALVAEIESKRKYAQHLGDNAINSSMRQFYDGMKQGCVDILSFLDTIEVKEVDLEKEYKDFVDEDPVYNKLVNGIVGKAIAKHFFELGLKAQKGE